MRPRRGILAMVNVVLVASVFAQTPRRVTIDVKPGDEPTMVEPTRGGMLPVAILTTPQFDAAKVDPATITVGATGTEAGVFRCTVDDVDHDGDLDRLCLVRLEQMQLTCSVKEIQVRGKTATEEFVGSEAVKMDGCDVR